MSSKKSQSAFEFIVIVFILLIFFVSLMSFLSQQFAYSVGELNEKGMEEVLDMIEAELVVSQSVAGSYERIFKIPETIEGREYNISVNVGRELIISDEFGSLVRFMPNYIYGELQPGKNRIIKRGPMLGLCWENCSDEYLFNSTGDLQCSAIDGLWQPCDPEFGDDLLGVRVQCSGGSSAKLNISNLDDSISIYSGVSSNFLNGMYTFDFTGLDLKIVESGWWNFRTICGLDPAVPHYFNIPYGHYEFYPVKVGSSCSKTTDGYDCPVNEFFELFYTVECVGGECGDTEIWLDP